MSKVRIKLNTEGVRQILTSNEMMTYMDSLTSNKARSLGDGYSSNSVVGKKRIQSRISADTYKARMENNKNNTLLKAIGGR